MEEIRARFDILDESLWRFEFYSEEKVPYMILLPSGVIWHLSPDVKYNLIANKSPLYFDTMLMMRGDSADKYDFTASNDEVVDLLTFFYIVNYPERFNALKTDYMAKIIILASRYAPGMTQQLFDTFAARQLPIEVDRNHIFKWWDLVALSQDIGVNLSQSMNRWICLVYLKPHTLYLHNKHVSLDKLEVTEDLKEHWRSGSVWKLIEIEQYQPEITETNRDGKLLLRIPLVAKKMGYDLTGSQLHDCGRFIAPLYLKARGRKPPKIMHKIDGARVLINHYTLEDYEIVTAGICEFFKLQSDQTAAPLDCCDTTTEI